MSASFDLRDLRHKALDGLNLQGKHVLEIGPLDRPIVLRSPEYRAYYMDHCSTEELRQKYRDNPVIQKEKIVEVDFIASDGSVSSAAIKGNKFDIVVAAHVIEHVPNLVGWLLDIALALNTGGHLALVVPDRRYTLDIFRRRTPKAWIEVAAAGDFKRPGLPNVVDYFANVVRVSCLDVWEGRDTSEAPLIHSAIDVGNSIKDWNLGGYIDCHSWVFESGHFKSLMEWLFDRYKVPFRVEQIIDPIPGQLEFYAQFVKL